MNYNAAKNIVSSLIALILLLIIWPVLLLIAVIIKADSKGPVIFKQKRIGIGKSTFNIYKFRTMRIDTPDNVPTHLLDSGQYITRVGHFLRKHSLDELPQLFNILKLKGEMVFVGPRPALWNQYDLIEARDLYGANDIYPGLTGWAQINGRDELSIAEKAALDGYYAAHMGPKLDLRCLFGTVASVFSGKGVVEGRTQQKDSANLCVSDEIVKNGSGKKKALLVTNHSYMLWRFRRELIEELMNHYEVVLSMPFVGHETDFADLGLRCIETNMNRRGTNPFAEWKLFRFYGNLIRDEKPDLVITYSIKPNIYAGMQASRHHVRYVANVQGLGTAFQRPFLARLVSILYRRAFRQVHAVFFENTANAGVFRERKLVAENKIITLPGAGVNLDQYSFTDYPHNERTHFLYLGRIMKEKGMDELFWAVRRMKEEGLSFVLDLVGFFEDEYEGTVQELSEKGIVEYHGFQQDPRSYYEKVDCVVLPSYHEGMSNVLLEAAAMGRPVITSDIPGCREAVEDGQSGYLAAVGDREDLLIKMSRFLNLTFEEREAFGRHARRLAEQNFDRNDVVEKTMGILIT